MWQSRREMNHLLDAVTVSNTAIGSAFQSINPMMQNATGVNQSQSDLDAARKAIQLRCVEAEADVQDRGALVSEAFVLPWHRSLVTAQDAYSTVSHAWQHKLTACADDASRWADGSTTAQILASFKAAHRAFTNAVPPGDQPDRSRVEVLFKE